MPLHVQLFLFALVHQTLPRALLLLPAPILDKAQRPAAQSGPSYSPVLLEHVPRSGPRDHTSQSRFPPSHPYSLPPTSRPTPLFQPPYSAPHHITQFASSASSYTPNMDRYSIANLADRYLRGSDKYSHNQHPLLDQRRMSEPAMRGSTASSYPPNTPDLSSAQYHQLQHQYSYTLAPRGNKTIGLPLHPYDSADLGEPSSPLNPTFAGGDTSPLMGTGTSTSSNAPPTHQPPPGPSSPSNNKQYSFVSLPGNAVKKRPRRRYDEIERLYQCSWPNCTKSYGTLNHLNAHITMQKHGPKRSPNEFKELRKQWRKAKREEAEARALDLIQHQQPSQHHTSRHSMSDADPQSHNPRPPVDYAHHPERSVQPIGSLDDLHDSFAHQQDTYPRKSRYSSLVSPHHQHSGIQYPHPHAHGASTSHIPVDRLPPNSTLLTPLPGYEPSSMSAVPGFNAYDSYGLYRDDSRPRTGHGSPASHGDRGRPRS
ncbi:hypothetical protein J3R82DRAFT_2481 [Butyriboletus roseoflavus]|nr:hypothetical protein J3R82DRAFT_2481 [Butyriboletus roseoflavus]